MQVNENQPLTRRAKWTRWILILIFCAGLIVSGKLKNHLEIANDFKKFTDPAEADLIYSPVSVVYSPVTDGFVVLEFPDGRQARGRFVDVPTRRPRKNPGPVSSGAFKNRVSLTFGCPRMHAELLEESPKLYWIYTVDCDGKAVLRYSDTIQYLQRRLNDLGVNLANYGPITRLVMKLF
jgi:hypothetical protein